MLEKLVLNDVPFRWPLCKKAQSTCKVKPTNVTAPHKTRLILWGPMGEDRWRGGGAMERSEGWKGGRERERKDGDGWMKHSATRGIAKREEGKKGGEGLKEIRGKIIFCIYGPYTLSIIVHFSRTLAFERILLVPVVFQFVLIRDQNHFIAFSVYPVVCKLHCDVKTTLLFFLFIFWQSSIATTAIVKKTSFEEKSLPLPFWGQVLFQPLILPCVVVIFPLGANLREICVSCNLYTVNVFYKQI